MVMLGNGPTMLKMSLLQRFTKFIDCNSSPNGRKEGSHGAPFYFNPKFYTLRTPNPDDPQYEFKCKHSVLYEFNRTLEEEGMGKISIGTFHSWLKQHRPYVGICPSQSDYCDNCKEYNEEIARARQIANRLKQSGHSTEESILEQEQAMVRYTALLQQHKRLKQGWNTTGGLPLKQNQCTSTSALCSNLNLRQ